jgi:hydrogenase/urease accessory protein HupE
VPLRTGYGFVSGNVVAFDFVYEFDEGAEQLQVVSTLDRITQSDHRHLLQIGEGAEIRQAILSRDYPSIDIDHAMGIPLWVTMKEFALLGVEHIFTGYDHLAFLVALLVATTSLRALVTIVTAFTIGHSVTLALASLDIVVVPSRLIESLIALSIAYVAIENFLGRRIVHRWLMTFLFGLVHGFGFANILRELGLTPGRLATSLFSFNAGVEAGQLAFVAIVSPLLWWAAKSTWKDAAVTASSVVIMCLGFYWFVQRAVFG